MGILYLYLLRTIRFAFSQLTLRLHHFLIAFTHKTILCLVRMAWYGIGIEPAFGPLGIAPFDDIAITLIRQKPRLQEEAVFELPEEGGHDLFPTWDANDLNDHNPFKNLVF